MKLTIPAPLKNRKTLGLILSALVAVFGVPLPELEPMVPLGVQLLCTAIGCAP
jgi:hypothetical protein